MTVHMKIAWAKVALATALIGLLCGCVRQAAPANKWITLRTGAHVTVVGTEVQDFKNVAGVQIHQFSVEYVTAVHNFEDHDALQNEVADVLAYYDDEITKAGCKKAVVTPVKIDDTGHGYEGRPFYLDRRADGAWLVE